MIGPDGRCGELFGGAGQPDRMGRVQDSPGLGHTQLRRYVQPRSRLDQRSDGRPVQVVTVVRLEPAAQSADDRTQLVNADRLGGDGSDVAQFDLVTYSMGGLIARAYLSGLQFDGSLASPLPHIRKLVEIATPNFGSFIAATSSPLAPR
jgi:triacylglycerol esterase/lipase EstA (alpha/beta hydrolase family)